jgi:hypothetical protein
LPSTDISTGEIMTCKTPLTTAQLRINEPCEADWSVMTLSEGKRFCSLCTKDVHDLSSLTRDQALSVITTASKPCVRYSCNEEGEILFKPSGPKARPAGRGGLRRGMRLAAMLGLSLMGGRAQASDGFAFDEATSAIQDARSWIASRAVEALRTINPVDEPEIHVKGEMQLMGGATYIEPVIEPVEEVPVVEENPVERPVTMGRIAYHPPADQD